MTILAIYDSGDKYADRYTVITDEYGKDDHCRAYDRFLYLGCSEGGLAVSMFGNLYRHNIASLKTLQGGFRKRTYLGKLVRFDELSQDTQDHINYRLRDDEGKS